PLAVCTKSLRRSTGHPAPTARTLRPHNALAHEPSRRLFVSSSAIQTEALTESAASKVRATKTTKPTKPTKTTKSIRTGAKNTKWPQEVDDMILSLRNDNRTWEYIGLATKRASSACSDRYYTVLDPSLKQWTPAMFTKLDQMVEDGARWGDIAAALNSRIVTCMHQWRTLGKGTYRVKGMMSATNPLLWTPQEINAFWSAWHKHGTSNWKAIAAEIRTKSATECKQKFKILVMNAFKEAPGWVKLEVFNYISDTIKTARARRRQGITVVSKDVAGLGEEALVLRQQQLQWTPEEHEALLSAVEKYGLFSGWTNIRKQVKPYLDDEAVEAEYYKLNGVAIHKPEPTLASKADASKALEDLWTGEETEKLNTMLMKYSALPYWTDQASQHGVTPSDSDYDDLFKKPLSKTAVEKKPASNKKLGRTPSSSVSSSSLSSASSSSSTPTTAETIETSSSPSLSLSSSIEPDEQDQIWTKQRINRLKRLVSQQRQQEGATGQPVNWSWIANHIGPGIDASMCITRWQSLPDHQANLLLEPAKFWADSDTDRLIEGIVAHGRAWVLVQANYLSDRTTDSIRRKVSNLQKKRDRMVEEYKEIAVKLQKRGELEGSIDDYMHERLKESPVMVLAKRIDGAFEQYDRHQKAAPTKDSNPK
ncbi:hypothetical protein KVV02_004647, partial [Mortierella alpina]